MDANHLGIGLLAKRRVVMAKKLAVVAVLVTGMLLSTLAFAATKTYQVTGKVVEVLPDAIIVMKGSEHWEIRRDADTKMPGQDSVQVGDTVTIHYSMHATLVEKKAAKAKAAK
jgi:hypothetical protein